jgi:hypothetical protein
VVNYRRLLRAALVNLDRWVTDGTEPPPSNHPRVYDGTAIPPEQLSGTFESIPGSHIPGHFARPRRLDFGLAKDVEQTLTLPPAPGKSFGSLVSAVDEDGNEVAGIAVPEIAVPLATHTGWNLRHPDIGGEEHLLIFAGSTIPFMRDQAEREAAGDPRPAIEERYSSKEDYLDRVREAAEALAAEGYMLSEDIEPSTRRASIMWDYFTRR